ncbi:Uu.00g070970.m01.CDS01 [Anthostomella pinea]|uniref:Uu.00g070970.m01.CDS01 n=1 Tax=Anthostomella pinea TaxID=933095 RepID=A0AAI8VUS1_9PEZI|nr:Uu.00g070970.m01.CDS01 [Anthostomella pinea]
MARLNEPMVSTDNLDTLRRKFLRQNRDIARVNSTQSLKIRALENECARMLSENLELRGQILRLDTELRESQAHRIADHALEIKEKMEAQLLEWGAMLAGLGNEPIPKNRSPRATKKARISTSLDRPSFPEWRRRDTMSSMKDLEAAAQQEGRLPPLWENKQYPRETLNREEILALCSEADENTDSPDLGPPPVSRFVDEDPVKCDLPTRPTKTAPAVPEPTPAEEPPFKEVSNISSPVAITKLEMFVKEEPAPKKAEKEEPAPKKAESDNAITKSTTKPQPPLIDQVAKANLKRKSREDDEKENAQVPNPLAQRPIHTKPKQEKATTKHRPAVRPVKEPSSHRKEAQDKTSISSQRKPLGAKSSNEVMNSPKKSTKPPVLDAVAKAKADLKRDERPRESSKPKQEVLPVEIVPPPSPAPVASIEIKNDSLSAESHLVMPESPAPSVPREDLIRDTPPPTDISSKGETSRGSRRARSAVSYAEPNLRDKMRRPTKQLFDAVSGEGKQIRRTSHSAKDEPASGPSSVARSEGRSESSRKDLPTASEATQALDVLASPLVQKATRAPPVDDLPAAVVTDRKRISIAVGQSDHSESSAGASVRPTSKGGNKRLEEIAAREAEVAKMFDDADIYEFTPSSPSHHGSTRDATSEETGGKKSKGARTSRARRQSSMAQEGLVGLGDHADRRVRNAGGRKRASMMPSKTAKLDAEDAQQQDGPAVEGDSLTSVSSADAPDASASARDRAATRRRSMML